MIIEDIKKCFNSGLDYTGNYLNNNIFNFTPEEQTSILPLLQKYIMDNAYYSLNPFLSYLYYCQNDNHLCYFFSKKEYGMEYENIRILYNILSMVKMGYLYNVSSIIDDVKYNNILNDNKIPVVDRLSLVYVLKKDITLDNCDDKNCINLYRLIKIQNELINNIRLENHKKELEDLYNFFSDVFIKTSIKLLLSHYFDKELYKSIPHELLNKFCNKEAFDDYIEEKTNIIKYCIYNQPNLDNAQFKDFNSSVYKVLSYSNEIGFSFHALVTDNSILLFDCGAKLSNDDTSYPDFESFFNVNNLDKSKILGIVITHAHFDHVGSYNELIKYLGFRPNVYLTKETYNLASLVNNIFFENYIFVEQKKKVKLNDDIKIEFIPNGHILGSVAIMVDCLGSKILFTGDFCLHNQNYVSGFDIEYVKRKYKNIDLIVTETTYGNKYNELEYEDNVIILEKILQMLNSLKYMIFIPAFAIGRSQELLTYIRNAKMRKISVLGMAFKICKYYQEVTGRQLIVAGVNMTDDKTIEEITNSSNVIIASSGMLVTNTNSYNCYNELIDSDYKVALLKTGYLDETCNGAFLVDKWENSGKPFFEISLSAHASYYELLTLINYLNPKDILYVHGNGIKVKK